MNRLTCIAALCAALAAASALLAPAPVAHAAAVPDDLGINAEVEPARLDLALRNIAIAHCPNADQHILYYVDGAAPGLLKVRTRADLGAILDTQLHKIAFVGWARADAGAALRPIVTSREVGDAMKQLNVQFAPEPPAGLVEVLTLSGRPRVSWYRLPRELDGLTLEQAFDRVARAFQAVVTVAYCDQPRLIEFEISNAPIEPRGSNYAPVRAGVDDLGVAAQLRAEFVQQAVGALGGDCKDAHVAYYADSSGAGFLEIETRSPLASLLDTRIRRLAFSEYDRSFEPLALYDLETSGEVVAAERRLRANEDPRAQIEVRPAVEYPPGSARMPREIDNATLRDVLGLAARTFGSNVTVATCEDPPRVVIQSFEH